MNEQIFWWINSLGGGLGDYPMKLFTITGYTVPSILIGLLAFYLYGGFNRRNIILLAMVLIIGGVVVHTVKQFYSTPRPLKYYSRTSPRHDQKINAPFTKHRARSFPSGHSQTAFGVATLLALLFRRHIPLWIGWAALVALSRVYLGLHFPIDIIAGSCIGGLIAYAVFRIGREPVEATEVEVPS